MRVIDYFEFIEKCSGMVNEEGYETFDELLHAGLNKKDLINLVVEFTSIIAKSDLTLDDLANPFDYENNLKEDTRPLKLVH